MKDGVPLQDQEDGNLQWYRGTYWFQCPVTPAVISRTRSSTVVLRWSDYSHKSRWSHPHRVKTGDR